MRLDVQSSRPPATFHTRAAESMRSRACLQSHPAPHLSLALARLSALVRQPPVYCTADADAGRPAYCLRQLTIGVSLSTPALTHPSPRVCIPSLDGKACVRRWRGVARPVLGWSRCASLASSLLHPSRPASLVPSSRPRFLLVSSRLGRLVSSRVCPPLASCLLGLGLALVAIVLGLRPSSICISSIRTAPSRLVSSITLLLLSHCIASPSSRYSIIIRASPAFTSHCIARVNTRCAIIVSISCLVSCLVCALGIRSSFVLYTSLLVTSRPFLHSSASHPFLSPRRSSLLPSPYFFLSTSLLVPPRVSFSSHSSASYPLHFFSTPIPLSS